MEAALRLEERPLKLLARALGGARERRAKFKALVVALWGYGRPSRVEARLERLQRVGQINEIPALLQRMVGALDMMRFFIVPCAADYYKSKGISFGFHCLLRFLDDPASVIDPTGFNSTRDAIIGHVMQVVHANPIYDFQLLESFEDGMEQMERQVQAVLDGSHPRAVSIQAVVEDLEYHERLLEHVRDYRANPVGVEHLVRENIHGNDAFSHAERVFGTLPGAMRYFGRLPKTFGGAVHHLWCVRELPADA